MTRTRLRRLLLVTSDYHYFDDERIHTTSAFMRFVPELLDIARHIEICVPVHDGARHAGFSIERPGVTYSPLPPSGTIEEFLRRFPRDGVAIARRLYQSARRADLVWINGPHPLLPVAALTSRLARTRYLLWIRGDVLATTRSKYGGSGRRGFLATRTAHYLDRLTHWAAKDAAVFYTGRGVERYAEGARYAQMANSSLVSQDEIARQPRRDVHTPVRLLWAGQLRPVKGLTYLLRAVRLLRDRGHAVTLTIVGSGEQRDELESEARQLAVEDQVVFAGYAAPGPALSRYFEDADIFVLPSLSEGVPKVLIEAMARGLPAVASSVGGIPDVVQHERSGLLVQAADPEALATAIGRLGTDAALRRRLSSGALAYAAEHTAQAEVGRLRAGLERAFPQLWGTSG